MAAHDDFEEFLGRGERQLAHAEIVDDEQGEDGEIREILFAGAVHSRVG